MRTDYRRRLRLDQFRKYFPVELEMVWEVGVSIRFKYKVIVDVPDDIRVILF